MNLLKTSIGVGAVVVATALTIGVMAQFRPKIRPEKAANFFTVTNAVEIAPLATLIDQYLRAETFNENTTKAYTQSLDHFVRFVCSQLRHTPKTTHYAEITKKLILQFRENQLEMESEASAQLRLRVVKAFCGWVAKQFHTEDPTEGVRNVERSDEEFKGLEPEQYARMVQKAKLQRDPLRRIVPLLLVWTGLRNDEACNLTINQISPDMRWIHRVSGKSAKLRNIPISPELASELATYLATRESAKGSHPLLLSNRQRQISPKTMWRIVNDIGDTHPHALRHTYAYRTIDELEAKGFKLMKIARILMNVMGHQSFQTTLKYLNLREGEIAAAFFDNDQEWRRA